MIHKAFHVGMYHFSLFLIKNQSLSANTNFVWKINTFIFLNALTNRKSASWVEKNNRRKSRRHKKHNLNPHFDENSVYRRSYPRGQSGYNPRQAIDLPNKNRAKETSRLVSTRYKSFWTNFNILVKSIIWGTERSPYVFYFTSF